VPAIWARNRAAERSGGGYGIPRVHDTLDDLLLTEVAVVDIAVVPEAQVEIALALDAGKDVMCQKPLALTVEEAARIVERADCARSQGRRPAADAPRGGQRGGAGAIERGCDRRSHGHLLRGQHRHQPRGLGLVGHGAPALEIYFHSIHYLDTLRAFLGEPTAVFGTQWRLPGQKPVGETRTVSVLLYPGDVRGIVHSNQENVAATTRPASASTVPKGRSAARSGCCRTTHAADRTRWSCGAGSSRPTVGCPTP
jgi:predicted dehydrogenase